MKQDKLPDSPAKNLTVTAGVGMEQAVKEFEQWFVWWALQRNNFNQSKTAEELKTHRNNLVRWIVEWGWVDKIHAAQNGSDGESPSEVGSSEGAVIAGHGPVFRRKAATV